MLSTSLMSHCCFRQVQEKTQLCDPARHPWTVLASFLDSLTDADQLEAVDRLIRWERQLQDVRPAPVSLLRHCSFLLDPHQD